MIFFYGYFGINTNVSKTPKTPKLRGSHFEGSIIPQAHFKGSKTLSFGVMQHVPFFLISEIYTTNTKKIKEKNISRDGTFNN